ncbi:energy transducer TonB [Yersinia sp. J1]|uniref:energy transducer TonB n=1 Tax=Yersinia sp. J1 TaxID=3424774 RepID=UPI003D35DB17
MKSFYPQPAHSHGPTTAAAHFTPHTFGPPEGNPRTRWTASLLLGLALHLLAAVLMLGWWNRLSPQGALPPAVMVEMAIFQQAKTAPTDLPQGVLQQMAAPDDVQPVKKELLEQPKLALSPRGTHAIRPEKVDSKKKPVVKPKPTETPLPVIAENTASTTSAPLPGSAKKNAANFSSASSAAINGKAAWQGEVLAHIDRYKRYPREGLRYRLEGVSHVRFVVDLKGKVLLAELITSSGARILDREAMTLISRAQPMPAPPADILNNGTIEVIAPIAYNVKGAY